MIQINSNFSKLCRCCMETGKLDVFTTLFETQSLAKIIEICISEKISSDDRLPKNICQNCYDKIVACYLFIINCKNVQIQLLNVLKKPEIREEQKNDLSESEVLDTGLEVNYESSDEDNSISEKYKTKTNGSKIEISSCQYSKKELKLETFPNLNDTENFRKVGSLSRKIIYRGATKCQKHFLENSINNAINDRFKCKYCQKLFSEEGSLIEHLKNHSTEYKDVTKNEKSPIYSTKKKFKTSNQKHLCTDCNKYFEFIKHLEQHCKDTGHDIPRRFSCKMCLKKFLSNTRLNDHMRIHNNERPYKCSECGMTFTSNSNLKRHGKKHTGEKSYFCEVCGRGFIQKHTLTVHVRLHNGETPYVCELCGKGYRTKPLLHQHMHKHKDTETQIIKYRKYYLKYGKMKVECSVCKKIITKSALYNHMKMQHGDGLKNFLCNLCGKTYATNMSLGVHMNIHTKKISYDCTVCSKSFTHQNYLKIHSMLHSGERPHCCVLCGKTFVQKTHLDRHMRTHTGAKPYACTYCDKTFALNENLKVHNRIHTGETPHLCSVCGKGFFNSSSKKKHEINIHQMHQNIKLELN